jgi:UDP:flavonoid glycosyltransferase YjiC (YdhE family)
MTSMLVVTFNAGGNLPPALGIAREAQRRGGEVRFLGHPQQQAAIEGAGFRFEPFRRGRGYDASVPRRTLDGLLDFTAMVSDRGVAADVLEAAAAEPTDAILIDCLLYRALADAVAAGLPVVQLMHTLYRFNVASTRGPVGIVSRLRGVNPVAAISAPPLTLVATRPEFDGGDPPSSVHHVGFVWQGTPVAARPRTTPRVLVSFSTTSFPGQLEALQNTVDGLAGLDAEVVVTTGPSIEPAQVRSAANTTIHRYVDHGELLPETSLVIGHGGHSTVARALSYGIPMLLLPMHPLLDQPAVAQAVADQGAGIVLPRTASPERIREAAEALLADGPQREAAARLGESIRKRDGAAVAADLVDDFVRTRVASTA